MIKGKGKSKGNGAQQLGIQIGQGNTNVNVESGQVAGRDIHINNNTSIQTAIEKNKVWDKLLGYFTEKYAQSIANSVQDPRLKNIEKTRNLYTEYIQNAFQNIKIFPSDEDSKKFVELSKKSVDVLDQLIQSGNAEQFIRDWLAIRDALQAIRNQLKN